MPDQQTNTPLPPGTRAPNFEAPIAPTRETSLADFSGAPLVLIFYPADWSPVCGDELALFNELLPEFERLGARLLGVSCDGPWCHLAYARDRNLEFPLLSDSHPKADVSRAYQAYRENEGVSERALYVIDGEGRVAYSYISPIDVNPGAAGVLAALERLSGETSDHERPLEARP
jgi:peroxiredoxin